VAPLLKDLVAERGVFAAVKCMVELLSLDEKPRDRASTVCPTVCLSVRLPFCDPHRFGWHLKQVSCVNGNFSSFAPSMPRCAGGGVRRD